MVLIFEVQQMDNIKAKNPLLKNKITIYFTYLKSKIYFEYLLRKENF